MLDAEQLDDRLIARAVAGIDASGVVAVMPDLHPYPERGRQALGSWWAHTSADEHLLRLPNPWNDRVAVSQMERVCDDLTVQLLDGLAGLLADIHGVRHNARYWEALIGPLLSFAVTGIADRSLFVRAAAAAAPGVPVAAAGGSLQPPSSVWEAINLQLTEAWNLALVEHLALGMGVGVQPRNRPSAAIAPGGDRRPLARRLVQRSLSMGRNLPLWAASRMTARTRDEASGEREVVILGQVKLDARQLWRLRRSVRGLSILPTGALAAPREPPPAHPARAELAGVAADGDLGATVAELLPVLIPRTALEDYPHLVAESRRVYGAPCHVVHGNWAFGDLDGEFVGRCRSAGHNVAFAQHGGATYQLALAPHERHERRVGTAQLSWGHTSGPERKVTSPQLAKLAGRHRGGDRVVIVEGLCPPLTWTYRFTSTPIGDQWLDEQDRLVRFVEAVDSTRRHLELRRYPGIAFDGARHPTIAALPVPADGLLPRTATDLMRRSRLAILAYPDTPFLEAMVLGTPVIGVWNPRWWEMREDARAIFDALREVQIVHDRPESAAAHLDAVYVDPAKWWNSPTVRQLRREFCARFAADGSWLSDWRRVLSAPRETLSATEPAAR